MVENRYDLTALHRLHPRLNDLCDLPYTSEKLRWESSQRADKLSIQGVQPKLSARLNVKNQIFELVDQQGFFILKPQHIHFSSIPENEDLTMKLAKLTGLEVPDHGLIYGEDEQLTYWIRRFDRMGRGQKIPIEDFAQLLEESRDTKYRSSMEKVAGVLKTYCTFPQVEMARLFKLVLFNFCCGNEDQHLKNFSLISESNVIRLSPAYDLLSSTIVLKDPEELALPLRGKKRKLKAEDLLEYYGQTVLALRPPAIENILRELAASLVQWPDWVRCSFLPEELQEAYLGLVAERTQRLGLASFEVDSSELELLQKASLKQGSGGHQSFFKQLERYRAGPSFCLTPRQQETIQERTTGSGGWQTAYRLLDDKVSSKRKRPRQSR